MTGAQLYLRQAHPRAPRELIVARNGVYLALRISRASLARLVADGAVSLATRNRKGKP